MSLSVVFIDGGYLSKILNNQFQGSKIDFFQFSERLSSNIERLRTYFYTCMPFQSNPPTKEERNRYSSMDKFVFTLRRLPRFEVRLGKLSKVGDSFVQKRVDILMAVDLVRLSWGKQISKAILVTGDSDFVPAIEAAKDAGVLAHLFYSPTSIHDELLSIVDERNVITQEIIDSVTRE